MKPRLYYEKKARDIIKGIRDEKQLTYSQLADRLQAHGSTVDTRVLINRINRGRFTFAFALQVLAAMEVEILKLPNVVAANRRNGSRRSFDSPFEPPEGSDDDAEQFKRPLGPDDLEG